MRQRQSCRMRSARKRTAASAIRAGADGADGGGRRRRSCSSFVSSSWAFVSLRRSIRPTFGHSDLESTEAPRVWLLDDRIIPATELWVAWNDHVFSFDRISRVGSRITGASLDNAGNQVTSPPPSTTQPLP